MKVAAEGCLGFPSLLGDCLVPPQCGMVWVGAEGPGRFLGVQGLASAGHNPRHCCLPQEPRAALESESSRGLKLELNGLGKSPV